MCIQMAENVYASHNRTGLCQTAIITVRAPDGASFVLTTF